MEDVLRSSEELEYNSTLIRSSFFNFPHFFDKHIISKDIPRLFLPMFVACIAGALIRTLLKNFPIPYSVLLCIIGIIMGTAGVYVSEVALLVFPGYLVCCAFTALISMKMFNYNWSWNQSLLLGAIISSTDPILSAASLKDIVTSKMIIIIIEAEALLCDSTCVVLFELFKDRIVDQSESLAMKIVVKGILKFILSPIFGFLVSRILMFWLSRIFNDGLTEVSISFIAVYAVFYLAEWCGMSGVIAVTSLGLLLDKISFSPDTEIFLKRFWEMLTNLANTLVFVFVGIVIAGRTFQYITPIDIFNISILYIGLNVIRLLVVVALSPLLCRMGYGFNWRWGTIIIWSGLRGAFTLNMALVAFQTENLGTEQDKSKILLIVSLTTLLTLLINASSVQRIVNMLGLSDISAPKRMAMYSAVRHIQDSEAVALSMLKMDRFLADANWSLVKSATEIEDPYMRKSNLCIEELFPHFRAIKCPDCEREIPSSPSSKELEDMMEEARLRMLKAEMTSYWRQYSCGMLNRETTRTLINAAENHVDNIGKFMDIQEVKQYWEAKGFCVFIRRQLEDWVYNVKIEKIKQPKNKALKICYRIFLNNEFEYVAHIAIAMNIFPVVIDFLPILNVIYAEELELLNFFFITLYFCEATIKALAMRRAYIFNHWNQFDLFILLIGIVEMIVHHIMIASGTNFIKFIRTFRFLRLIRVLRLFKIAMPNIINFLNKQINKQLSFGYDIAKGFILGEEDVKYLVERVSDQQIITEKLLIILEKNLQDAMKELGLLQRDHPEIVTSVKTNQAIRTILNNAKETLSILTSQGLIDINEGVKVDKIIQLKIKELSHFPSTILPATAEELLHSVPWLENDKAQIQFIKSKAKILFFDYGDTICKQGQKPRGIHLLVSGMVKLCGSNPDFGHYKDADGQETDTKLAETPYTDYRCSGAIFGEVNCLTNQVMEFTITCETAVQTCFISMNNLFEAFDAFMEFPSLEYKIWLAVAVKTAIKTFKENIAHQNWTVNKIFSWLSHAYVEDIEINRQFDIFDGSMDDLLLVYGSVIDCQQQQHYYAPCFIPKTSHRVQGTANITKVLIVPSIINTNVKATASGNIKECVSAPCLQHSAARRRMSKSGRGSISIAVSDTLIMLGESESQTDEDLPGNLDVETKN
ncbi:sperm-specific sodium:proton exchanger-like isoform X3 [Ascaphus truei]|uniref:sperm-specific sodium:proton exchanger-like isoform X3 n=1 Tax=Ascaphus truei TaxID=8439 RepID=UPI003F597139